MTDQTTPEPHELHARLLELEQRIEQLEQQLSAQPPHRQEWHESGSIRPDLDDQSIAP